MKKQFILILGLILLIVPAVSGCNGDDDKVSLDDVKKQAAEAMDTAVEYTKQQHDKLMAQFDEQYKLMQSQAAVIMEQAKQKAQEGQANAQQAIMELQQKQAQAAEKFQAMQDAGEDTYKQAKLDLAEAMKELSEAIANASEELKKD